MKFFWAIIVAGIIVYLSGVSFTMLKIAMGDNPSIIATIFQLTPFLIGIWLIKYSWVKITYTEKIEEISSNTDTSLSKAVLNHSKELIKEIKPAINDYVDKHTKIENPDNFKEEESNMINSEINEDEIYENVLLEIEEDNKVKSTWARALAQSEGNKDKAESIYIKERFLTIQKENFKLKDNFDSNSLNNTQIEVETFHDKTPIFYRKDELNLFMKQEGLHLVNYISEEEVICQPNNGPIERKVIYIKDKWQYSNNHYYPEIVKPTKDLKILSKLETKFLDKYNVNKNDKNVHIFLDEIIIELEEGNKKYIRCKN